MIFMNMSNVTLSKIQELKKQLKAKFPDQVFEYNCKCSGVLEKAGRKRVRFPVKFTFNCQLINIVKNISV